MAAQTSTDAQAPVSLALMKLGVFFMWEWVQEVIVRICLYSHINVLVNWFHLDRFTQDFVQKFGSLLGLRQQNVTVITYQQLTIVQTKQVLGTPKRTEPNVCKCSYDVVIRKENDVRLQFEESVSKLLVDDEK